MPAVPPSTAVTAIPGRFSPAFIVDKRNPASIVASTATNQQAVQLFRTETVDSQLDTPTTPVTEVGTNFNVGEYDDLPESKLHLQSYDVGPTNLSLITGKAIDQTSGHTTTFGYSDLATAVVDVIRQFADPNGNIFASAYHSDMVLNQFGFTLKEKSTAMEDYQLSGFNMLLFRGFFLCKAYVVQAADVTAHAFAITSILGADELPVALPVPSGSQPASYWIQRGCYNFVKIDRYRAATGWTRFKEVTVAPTVSGTCQYTSGTKTLSFIAGDLVAGDIFLLTFPSYKSDVTGYNTIPSTSADTSDPVGISTRLTPFTINANAVTRGSTLDGKLTLKRTRVEGVGDVDGIWSPPDSPQLAVSLEVRMTDMGLTSNMGTGSTLGTDNGGTVSGDFADPNYWTRVQLNTATPVVAQILDPRNAGVIVKTYTMPTCVFKSYQNTASAKNPVTSKFTGEDRVGNMTIAYTHP